MQQEVIEEITPERYEAEERLGSVMQDIYTKHGVTREVSNLAQTMLLLLSHSDEMPPSKAVRIANSYAAANL